MPRPPAGRCGRHRSQSRPRRLRGRVSYVSYLVKAAADVVAEVPEARTVLRDGLRPRLAVVQDIHVKVLFDKTVEGTRCVVAGTVARVQDLDTDRIQDEIDLCKKAAVEDPQGPFRQLRRLQRLPLPAARLLYRAAARDPERRAALQGVFSVTSVGREPVRAILPMISGTLGFGMGRITDTPVADGGAVRIAPLLTLSLTFDHRVIDGALAAEVLARTKQHLEHWESR